MRLKSSGEGKKDLSAQRREDEERKTKKESDRLINAPRKQRRQGELLGRSPRRTDKAKKRSLLYDKKGREMRKKTGR